MMRWAIVTIALVSIAVLISTQTAPTQSAYEAKLLAAFEPYPGHEDYRGMMRSDAVMRATRGVLPNATFQHRLVYSVFSVTVPAGRDATGGTWDEYAVNCAGAFGLIHCTWDEDRQG